MIVEKAYLELYAEGNLGDYNFSISYSGKFKGYNANVKKNGRRMHFNLSKNWEGIGEDVQIGLIQVLMNRVLRTKLQTDKIELYEVFLKKVHIAVPKTKWDPVLEASFERMNEMYFNGLIEKPNLCWGSFSMRKLGSYDYGLDLITISKIFLNADKELLDFVMYHEMLHKKHKFYSVNGKSYHHTGEFARDESLFPNQHHVELKISQLAQSYRRKRQGFFRRAFG